MPEPPRVLTPRIGCENIDGNPEKKRCTEKTRMVLCHADCCWNEDDFGTFPQISVGMHIHGCTSETWKRLIVLTQKHNEVLVPLDMYSRKPSYNPPATESTPPTIHHSWSRLAPHASKFVSRRIVYTVFAQKCRPATNLDIVVVWAHFTHGFVFPAEGVVDPRGFSFGSNCSFVATSISDIWWLNGA